MISATVLLPLIAAAVLSSLPGSREAAARDAGPSSLEHRVALLGALATFVFSIAVLLALGDGVSISTSLIERHDWVPGLGVSATFRIDGMNVLPVVATALLTVAALLSSPGRVEERGRLFLMLSLALETSLLGFFTALDGILAFVFIESAVLCACALLCTSGRAKPASSAVPLSLWMSGSAACIFLSVLYVHGAVTQSVPESGIAELGRAARASMVQPAWPWVFLLVGVGGSGVLLPLFPADRWVAAAYRVSSPPTDMLLAGVLGIGVLGFARIVLPLFPGLVMALAPWLMALAILSVLVAAVRSFLEADGRGLVLRFSTAYLALALAGLLTFTVEGVVGGLVLLVHHTLSAAALYSLLGALSARGLSQRIGATRSLAGPMPRFARVASITATGAAGILPASGTIGVYLVARGLAEARGWSVAALAVASALAIAASLVLFCCRLLLPIASRTPVSTEFGSEPRPDDLETRELLTVLPLVLPVVMFGLFSSWFTDRMIPTVHEWLEAFR